MQPPSTYDWPRWWFPCDPPLDHLGLLHDPAGELGRYLTRDARRLADLRDEPCLVLLGPPGLGKSSELSRECASLSTATDGMVQYLDLGRNQSAEAVRRAFKAPVLKQWRQGEGHLTLVIDALDEVLTRVPDAPEIIDEFLDDSDCGRLSIRVACRDSRWPRRFNGLLRQRWSDVTELKLAPLTQSNVRNAAAARNLDPDRFLSDVAARGVGLFASRPMTLNLLLATAVQDGDLPQQRRQLYAAGVDHLLGEPDPRRRERDAPGPPLNAMRQAASRAAAVTLLCGAADFASREAPVDGPESRLALESLVGAGSRTAIDALDALAATGLVEGPPDALRWAHRTLEEYLCAVGLEGLSSDAIIGLLAHPHDPTSLVQDLVEVAAYVAEDNQEVFAWLADAQPEVLLGPPMLSATAEQRQRLVRAIIGHLQRLPLPGAWADFRHLDYDGFDYDLRPLLSDEQPSWARRTALRMLAHNGIRTLDDRLLEMVTAAAEVADHDRWRIVETDAAVAALHGCSDAGIITRLTSIAGDGDVAVTLRASIIDLLWPRHLATEVLPSGPSVDSYLLDRIAARIQRHVRKEELTLEELGGVLAWASAQPHFERLIDIERIFELCLPPILSAGPASNPSWETAVTAIRRAVKAHAFDGCHLRPESIAESERRRLALDLLEDLQPHQAYDLVHGGWIIPSDVPSLLAALDDNRPYVLAATVRELVTQLAPRLTDEQIALLTPSLSPRAAAMLDAIAGPQARQQRADERVAQAESQQQRDAEWNQHRFQLERFDAHVQARNWEDVWDDLDRPLPAPGNVATPQASPALRAWDTLDGPRKDQVCDIAVAFLTECTPSTDSSVAFAASAAHDVVASHRQDALEEVPADSWRRWLPAVLDIQGHAIARTALREVQRVDDADADAIVIQWLRARMTSGHPDAGTLLYAGVSEAVGAEALDLIGEAPPPEAKAIAALLRVAGRPHPHSAAELALRLAHRGTADGKWTHGDLELEISETGARCLGEIIRLPTLTNVLADVFALVTPRPNLGRWLLRTSAGSGDTWPDLTPAQCVAVYEWAKAIAPPERQLRPGESGSLDPVSGFPRRILGRLEQDESREAAIALSELADRSQDPWHALSAMLARRRAATGSWRPLTVDEALDVLDRSRIPVHSSSDLARLIYECLREIDRQIGRDRGLKALFWHRQRRGNVFGDYVAKPESEVSDLLVRLIGDQLRGRVAALREVQVQPRLAGKGADNPDIVIVNVNLSSGRDVCCAVEVKCSYNRTVITGLTDQLQQRYQRGPVGDSGVYVVAAFSGNNWAADDARKVRSLSIGDIRDALGSEGRRPSGTGTTYVALLSLDLDR